MVMSGAGRLRAGAMLVMVLGVGGVQANADGAHGAQGGKRHDPAAMWSRSLARAPVAVGAAFDAEGRLWLARVLEGHVVVSHSTDHGANFSAPVRVNAVPERIAADGENHPKLAFGNRGEIYVSWTQSLDVPFAGHIRFARSLDDGRRFSPVVTVNDDHQPISHRFESLAVDARGRVWLVWLDRRDQQAARDAGRTFPGISVYAAVSEDRGKSFAANRRIAENSCECCQIALAVDVDGVPVAAWRHVFGKNTRDHVLRRLSDDGERVRLSHEDWAVDACPHHGPSLAVASSGRYHAAWFSGAPQQLGLFYAHVSNRGRRIGAPMAFGDNDAQAGYPDVAVQGKSVYLVWKEFDGQRSTLRMMMSRDEGDTWSAPRTVAESSSRNDRPQVLVHAGRAWVVWNSEREGLRVIEAKP